MIINELIIHDYFGLTFHEFIFICALAVSLEQACDFSSFFWRFSAFFFVKSIFEIHMKTSRKLWQL